MDTNTLTGMAIVSAGSALLTVNTEASVLAASS